MWTVVRLDVPGQSAEGQPGGDGCSGGAGRRRAAGAGVGAQDTGAQHVHRVRGGGALSRPGAGVDVGHQGNSPERKCQGRCQHFLNTGQSPFNPSEVI